MLITKVDSHCRGSKMVGSGNRRQDASITFNLNGKPQLKLLSGFIFRPDRIVSVNAAAVIYWRKIQFIILS